MKFAVVISRFNSEVTLGLLKGALSYFHEQGATVSEKDIFQAPGAFEIPLIAQKLAKTGRYTGVVALGCVIKGDTAHFEFISLGATVGLMQSMLATETPISFGILTTYTEEQALKRSAHDAENKGREAATACFESARTLAAIAEL